MNTPLGMQLENYKSEIKVLIFGFSLSELSKKVV